MEEEEQLPGPFLLGGGPASLEQRVAHCVGEGSELALSRAGHLPESRDVEEELLDQVDKVEERERLRSHPLLLPPGGSACAVLSRSASALRWEGMAAAHSVWPSRSAHCNAVSPL